VVARRRSGPGLLGLRRLAWGGRVVPAAGRRSGGVPGRLGVWKMGL